MFGRRGVWTARQQRAATQLKASTKGPQVLAQLADKARAMLEFVALRGTVRICTFMWTVMESWAGPGRLATFADAQQTACTCSMCHIIYSSLEAAVAQLVLCSADCNHQSTYERHRAPAGRVEQQIAVHLGITVHTSAGYRCCSTYYGGQTCQQCLLLQCYLPIQQCLSRNRSRQLQLSATALHAPILPHAAH